MISMPLSGLSFRKEKNPLSRRIQRLFEQVRADYLSTKQQPKEFAKDWEKAVDKLINIYSDISKNKNIWFVFDCLLFTNTPIGFQIIINRIKVN